MLLPGFVPFLLLCGTCVVELVEFFLLDKHRLMQGYEAKVLVLSENVIIQEL